MRPTLHSIYKEEECQAEQSAEWGDIHLKYGVEGTENNSNGIRLGLLGGRS